MAAVLLSSPGEPAHLAARQPDLPGIRPADAAATAQLVYEVVQERNPAAARQRLVDGLGHLWGDVRVALGSQRGSSGCRLAALSGQPKFERRSEFVRAVEAALDETLRHTGPVRWPAPDQSSSPLPTFRRVASLATAEAILGMKLPVAEGLPACALLLIGEGAEIADPDRIARLQGGAAALGGLSAILDQASLTPAHAAVRRGWKLFAGRGRWWGLGVAGTLAIAAWIPAPDRIHCSCTLEPQVRRYVAAPFEGTLEKALVAPGDVVTQGQPLALLDPRPLKLELAVLQAQEQEAAKRQDAALATRQAAPAQMAELERSQAAHKIEHQERRLQQMTLRSPLDGVIVRGDLERSEGVPLKSGESMFEIAPLSPMLVELAVAEDEVRLVEAGMPVSIRLVAFPSRTFTGTVARIHPRAEVRDEQSVFIAEVLLDNQEVLLRPGMAGQAIISGRSQPLGWTLARRPVIRMTRWMWW
jgi:RND family efflux transporter MFP subunit